MFSSLITALHFYVLLVLQLVRLVAMATTWLIWQKDVHYSCKWHEFSSAIAFDSRLTAAFLHVYCSWSSGVFKIKLHCKNCANWLLVLPFFSSSFSVFLTATCFIASTSQTHSWSVITDLLSPSLWGSISYTGDSAAGRFTLISIKKCGKDNQECPCKKYPERRTGKLLKLLRQ